MGTIIRDQKRVFPCAVLLIIRYGHSGIFMGLPCIIGAGGTPKIIEIDLKADEKARLDESATAVKELMAAVDAVAVG